MILRKSPLQQSTPKIGIVGGGISGICAARACIRRGLDVTIFEKRSELGGLWSSEHSPVFDALTTNTATFETCLSDISPPRVLPSSSLSQYDDLCFTRGEMVDYIQSVVNDTQGLFESSRLSTKVISVKQTRSKTYRITFQTDGAVVQESEFDKVIIATGYFHTPFLPPPSELPGIDKYKDKVMHVEKYRNPSQLKGKRVLVVGGSVSGCEATGDMLCFETPDGPARVTLNTRSMRFLFLKQNQGEVLMSKVSTRFHRLRDLAGRLGNELYAEHMHTFIPQFLTNSDFPAPKPDTPIKIPFFPAWVPVNSKLYQACQQNKLEWKVCPLECITEGGVRFKDGTDGDYDVIVFASGYKLHLPFLEEDVQRTIFADKGVNLLDLYDYTFHPDVVNMAFVGIFPPGSAHTPMVDNQSRWVAGVFSGDIQLPTYDEMKKGVEQYKQTRMSPNSRFLVVGFDILDMCAKHGGFEVDLAKYPELSKALLLGPLVPAQFRLFGEDHSEDAMQETVRQFEAAGFMAGDNAVSLETYQELETVCQILKDKGKCPSSLPAAIGNLVVSKT